MIQEFTLIDKISLTQWVYELIFSSNSSFDPIPGQFVTFMIPGIRWWKSYSFLYWNGKRFGLIVKRYENGWWGSVFLSDMKVWDTLPWVAPLWVFLDTGDLKPKMYFATGTGIAPLYYIICDLLEKGFSQNITLIYGNRCMENLYYIDELKNLQKRYLNFTLHIFLSREQKDGYEFWYIKEYINRENIENFWEFYICGNPDMVDDVRVSLLESWVDDHTIFKEKY